MQKVKLERGHFHGVMDVDFRDDGSMQPWRTRMDTHDMIHPAVRERSGCPSGVRIIVKSNTSNLRLTTYPMRSTTVYDFDLVCDGQLLQTVKKEPARKIDGYDHMRTKADYEKIMGFVPGADCTVYENYKDIKGYNAFLAAHARLQDAAYKQRADDNHVVEFTNIPAGEHVLEVWLSLGGPQRIQSLEVDAGATAEVWVDPRPKWLVHGSSITHSTGYDLDQFGKWNSQTSNSPSRAWPATSARLGGVNLISLGFGGQGVMDTTLAMQIAETECDAISLKLGINVHNLSTHGLRGFGQAILGTLLTIRAKKPNIPIQLISPIYGAWRETMTRSKIASCPDDTVAYDPSFPTMRDMRTEMKRIVELLQKKGDKNIQYVDGLEIFGQQDFDNGLMPDFLHPNGDGYELMGRRHAALSFGSGGALIKSTGSKL